MHRLPLRLRLWCLLLLMCLLRLPHPQRTHLLRHLPLPARRLLRPRRPRLRLV